MFTIVSLSVQGADIYGKLKHEYLSKTGITRSALKRNDVDLMLASTAIADNMVLGTKDDIFATIQSVHDDFQLENWARP